MWVYSFWVFPFGFGLGFFLICGISVVFFLSSKIANFANSFLFKSPNAHLGSIHELRSQKNQIADSESLLNKIFQ